MRLAPQQLSGDERKVVLATLITLDAHENHLTSATGVPVSAVSAILSNTLAHAQNAAVLSQQARLDLYLIQWLNAAVPAASQLATQPGSATAIQQFINQLRSDVAALSCVSCPAGQHLHCHASWPTQATTTGACLSHFSALFEFACGIARDLYLRAGADAAAVNSLDVQLATMRSGQSVRRFVSDIGFSAVCRLSPTLNMPVHEAVVELEVPVTNPRNPQQQSELTVRGMQAVLYVLLHEIVIHAYQRIGATNRVSGPQDSFAEGWMDSLVQSLLADVGSCGSFPANIAPTWITDLTPGHELRNARKHASPQVRFGYSVAERVLSAMTLIDFAHARTLFERLSCGINVRHVSEEDRISIVSRLSARLPSIGKLPDAVHSGWEIVRKYMIDKDIELFVSRTMAL